MAPVFLKTLESYWFCIDTETENKNMAYSHVLAK